MLHLVPRVLRYVESVAEIGSIQRTSREIGIAASAIDRQILQLEESLGVQLFERQAAGMSLTVAGERVVMLARRWHKDSETLVSELKQMQGVDMGVVRVAVMDSQVNGLLPLCVERIARDYPRIHVEIEVMSPDAAAVALDRGDVDIAMAFNLRPQRQLHVLWSENLPLGCLVSPGHALARHRAVTLAEVTRHPLALQSRTLAIRQKLEKQFGWLIRDTERTVVTNSLQMVKQLAMRGGHVALTSEMDAATELLEGRLVFVPIEERLSIGQSIAIAVSTRRFLTRVARLVASTMCEEAATLLTAARQASDKTSCRSGGGDAARK
ncbi:LysR family transcriptional regulator [Paracoccus sp. (in: a-proteobacteria)]|uniref:LysR family transcriptional regulator n=1 Tax=Paracoccus sp. TaxID=267 RepID=UPI002AFEFAA1|nr:LysR family transcriptional regulator [Paracoccus sp. (in: a-proteobacteria)]